MRMIDADAVLDRYYAEFKKQDICDGSQDRDWLMRCIEEAPTFTPNEPLTCKRCVYHEQDTGPCTYCARMQHEVDYYCPKEGEEET